MGTQKSHLNEKSLEHPKHKVKLMNIKENNQNRNSVSLEILQLEIFCLFGEMGPEAPWIWIFFLR